MSKKRGVYELKKNELGPGPGLANDWTGCGGPGPGPEKMPQTWPGPDFGQSTCRIEDLLSEWPITGSMRESSFSHVKQLMMC